MNYYEIIEKIKETSLKHPFVNSFFIDRYSLVGSESDVEYGVISLLNQEHQVTPSTTTYSFQIIYADRLTEDGNKQQLHSVGMQTITEIVNALKWKYELDVNDSLNFNLFEGQFADECAGAICYVNIIVRSDVGDCEWINEGKEDVC